MSCTHPVIYRNGDGIPVCFVCGAILETAEETTAKEEKPTKKSKKTKADLKIRGRYTDGNIQTP